MGNRTKELKKASDFSTEIQRRKLGVCEAMDLMAVSTLYRQGHKYQALIQELLDTISIHFHVPKKNIYPFVDTTSAYNWMMIAYHKIDLIGKGSLELLNEKKRIEICLEEALQILIDAEGKVNDFINSCLLKKERTAKQPS